MKNDPRRPTVLLFDIDGTLVDTGGAGRAAMEAAFAHATGFSGKLAFPFGGMTDRGIVREALSRVRAEVTDSEIDRILDVYVALLADEMSRATRYRVMPGVQALLDELASAKNCAIGLGTGNVQRGAELKLERGGLSSRFAFGGFGSDHEDRAMLLGIGADRGAHRLGVTRAECRVVVIGDTLRDIAAAKQIGAESVAVATGGVSLELLTTGEPDALFADLSADGVKSVILMGVA